MSAHPTWFGPEAAPLLGVLHVPDDATARGAVVLCPPLGKEHTDSYRGLALLAQQLCAAGVVVLRFDYQGTGDSAGEPADDSVQRWLDSIATAVAHVRSTGVDHVALAGLRVGALLAAAAVARCGELAGLALWDPVTNGRSFLRHQRTLYRLTIGADVAEDGMVSLPFTLLAPGAVAELGGLRLTVPEPAGGRPLPVLVAGRPSAADDQALAALAARPETTRITVHEHEGFLEPTTSIVRIPADSVAAVARWLLGVLPAQRQPVVAQAQTSAVVAVTPDGTAVRESLHRRGPHQLFTIVTSTDHPPRRSLVLNSLGSHHRIGAGRMHVDLARSLAAEGVEVIRFDRRLTGDTTEVRADELAPMYAQVCVQDARMAAGTVRSAARDTVVAGVCAGGWMAMHAAAAGDAGTVVVLSPTIWGLRSQERYREAELAAAQQSGPDEQGPAPVSATRRHQVKQLLRRRLPYPLWLLLGRAGVTQVPEVALARLLRAGVDVTVVLTPADHTWFVEQRGPEGLRRLHRRGLRPRVVIGEEGDHSLLHRGMREQSVTEVRRAVLAHLRRRDADEDAAPV
ncbi:alpha/beta hydrolase [Rhodococcus sp. X156]|uniref:serine aminopeptidase domain-containing protein n=1 Tax=Rhodococcus sp. X156 TaxID=2499145 RepID=UPI000FDCCB06|nr:alpha/beta hydrolase [Rhodococcus sp. X156]